MADAAPVLIDRRQGSVELYVPLQKRSVPVELTSLEFGDAAFIGHGPAGDILVGVERKAIRDLLQSLTSGRLSGHQLPGCAETYAYRWLVVEGAYREAFDGSGFVELPWRGKWETIRFPYHALEHYLMTLTLRGGFHVQRTYTIDETARWIDSLWRWWTRKEWAEHRSHLATYQSVDLAVFFKPPLVQRCAAELPGIGEEKAAMVARTFHTVQDMANAPEETWRTIPGIGKLIAARAVAALQRAKENL